MSTEKIIEVLQLGLGDDLHAKIAPAGSVGTESTESTPFSSVKDATGDWVGKGYKGSVNQNFRNQQTSMHMPGEDRRWTMENVQPSWNGFSQPQGRTFDRSTAFSAQASPEYGGGAKAQMSTVVGGSAGNYQPNHRPGAWASGDQMSISARHLERSRLQAVEESAGVVTLVGNYKNVRL